MFMYRVFIKYCVFSYYVVTFLNSASSAAALVFDLPLCTHTDTEGKPREARVQNIYIYISKSSKKNTIFYEYPVYLVFTKC